MADYDILFALGCDTPDSLIGSYITHVANGGLAAYKTIFQWGKKAGEPVYVHFLNGVFTAERLRPLLGLSDTEARVLYSAYSIHDINKLVESTRKSFNSLAVKEAVQSELERIGVPAFFPAYQDYLEDITWLVRYHSGHYSTAAEGLIPALDLYCLDRERIQHVLGPLMRALDVLDLSSTLNEHRHKTQFLLKLNEISDVQYTFATHQVCEQRGLLTNLIHNQVNAYLENKWGLTPLLFYPNGVVYLAVQGQLPLMSADDLESIGQAVAEAAAGMTRGEFAQFIRSGNQGIKVDKQCLELGISFTDIFAVIYNRVAVKVTGKRFKIDDMETKLRDRLNAKFADTMPETQCSLLKQMLNRPTLYPASQAGMGAGELLRTYYIFLRKHLTEQVVDPWEYLYGWLKLTPEQISRYDSLDQLYERAYVAAGDLGLVTDSLYERILTDGERLMPAERTKEPGDYAMLVDYVARTLNFSFGGGQTVDFRAALEAYTSNNHRQCCYCGSEFPTQKWMSVGAPANVKVQSFSNRLPGGWSQEPKKNICDICRVQFTLEKLSHQAGNGKTIYLHIYPYTFYTDIFLQAVRDEIHELLSQDVTVVFPRSDAAFQSFLADNRVELPLALRHSNGKAYQNGIVLPRHTEIIGNMLIFTLNCPGKNDSEQFLFGLQNALIIQRYFGCKAVLTDSAVPILDKDDFADLFVDNAPLGFEGLLPQDDFDRAALDRLWNDVLILHRLRKELYNSERKVNSQLSLVRAMAESRLQLFFEADRLVEHKASQGRPDGKLRAWRSSEITKQILPYLRKLVKGEKPMEQLERLARLAWDNRIIGRSLERNALLKPFDMLLEGLEKRPETFETDTLRAQLTEDVFRHIEAIASDEYKPGRTKREKVKAYVNAFFDGVLGQIYRGNETKLLVDSKPLRSAYLFYIREQIPTKEKGD